MTTFIATHPATGHEYRITTPGVFTRVTFLEVTYNTGRVRAREFSWSGTEALAEKKHAKFERGIPALLASHGRLAALEQPFLFGAGGHIVEARAVTVLTEVE